MANPEHIAVLREGSPTWNTWRDKNSFVVPNLAGADLFQANLKGANLKGANLKGAFLKGAFLDRAILSEAFLNRANLTKVNLSEAILNRANLSGANLSRANLNRTNLSGADLSAVDLNQANLSGADLNEAYLSGADLRKANLNRANLSGANLQYVMLNQAILNDAILWETQRAEWSIKDIVCERVYWDEFGRKPTDYFPGEFEKLYSHQTSIELFYEGGISTFELNTLPALLHRLASKHPDAAIRLQTIEATGGGTKVTISLGDATETTKAEVETDAAQVLQAQLALRTDEVRRLQFERDFFQSQFDKINNALLATAVPQVHFHAPVHTAALPSGSATVQLHQTFNDNSELIQLLISLIDNLFTRNTALSATQSAEIEAAKAELEKPSPDKSRISRFYDFLKSLPKEAILKGAGKLGERAAEADWSNLLHQLGQFIHHLQ